MKNINVINLNNKMPLIKSYTYIIKPEIVKDNQFEI